MNLNPDEERWDRYETDLIKKESVSCTTKTHTITDVPLMVGEVVSAMLNYMSSSTQKMARLQTYFTQRQSLIAYLHNAVDQVMTE